MKNQNKIDWINTARKQYHVDKLGRLVHAEIMLKEAEISYIHEINYGSIFCIHSAFSSYLMQRLGTTPRIQRDRVRIDGLFDLLKKADFLSQSIKLEIQEFSRIRGNLEHPKSQLEIFTADWENDVEEGSPNLRMKNVDHLSEGIWFDPEKTAKRGLSIYYKMCDEIYNSLTNKK